MEFFRNPKGDFLFAKEVESNPDYVRLHTVILTNSRTLERYISISEGGGPCGIPEEIWLPVHASGSLKTGVYHFNNEEIIGRANVVERMKSYVKQNYPKLLLGKGQKVAFNGKTYDFGYFTEKGAVIYEEGERNMQDSIAVKLEDLILQ